MPFGGLSPFPKRLGGGTPRAKVILDSLNQSRGTGIDTSFSSPAYAEDLVAARAIASAWSTNQRLANIWNTARMTGTILARWEAIRAVFVAPGDSEPTRRRRLAAIEALTGIMPTHQKLVDLLSAALGNVFVAVEYISVANARINVPDAGYPFGTPNADVPWSSTVAHVLVRLRQPAGMSLGEFIDLAARVPLLLDPVLPAWAYADWYLPGPVSVAVVGGPSAGGFYLDDPHNLGFETFDV